MLSGNRLLIEIIDQSIETGFLIAKIKRF